MIMVFCLLALLLLIPVINVLCCIAEKKHRPDYGIKIDIIGGAMNVAVIGNGEKTVVLLPGSGIESPVLDFKQIAEMMSKSCTVVIPEPFGYGLSDITDRERSFENIAGEIHECLSKLGYKSYTLMGHSLSGITMLEYANLYPSEVKAIVALDTSVPSEAGGRSIKSAISLVRAVRLARIIGLIRLFAALGGKLIPPQLSKQDAASYKRISFSSLCNSNIIEALKFFNGSDGKHIAEMTYPDSVPVLTFLANDNAKSSSDWEISHRKISNHTNSRIEVLSGDHFVYRNHPEEIAKKAIDFIAENDFS